MLHPPRRNAIGCALALAFALSWAARLPALAAAGETPAPEEGGAKIIVLTPEEVSGFWKKLQDPDFIWMTGLEFQKRLRAASAAVAAPPPATGVVALAARGEVLDDLAYLAIDFEAAAPGPEPSWVAIRLDGQAVTRARENDRELPIRQAEKGGWQVEVRGAGRHDFRVEALIPVKVGVEGHALAFAIPEAASTRVELQVGPGVVAALAGSKDPLAIEPVQGGQRTRLAAHLPSRSRLELTWRIAAEPGMQLSPLLSARGEIALDVDRGTVRVASSWVVKSERGAARSLELTLDPAEELLELALDGAALPAEGKLDRASSTLSVPLPEPLRPGASRKLTMTTRRPTPTGRWTFAGASLAHASSQAGFLSVSQGEGLWLSGTEGRGLVQIDPRGDVPETLRRPSAVLAYRFLDQPFALGLRVDPVPPSLRASMRTLVAVDAGSATVDTRIDYRVTRGRVFEVRVGVPRGLELKTVGPDEVVESSQVLAEAAAGSRERVLVVVLKAKAREGGAFRVHLNGRQALGTPGEAGVGVGLFQPADSDGGILALTAARNVSADLPPDAVGFATAAPTQAADWPELQGRPAPATWLRQDGTPGVLPLKLAIHPRTVQVETTLTAEVDRASLAVRQESHCQVRHGTLSRVDVAVPGVLQGRWEVEGAEVAGREPRGPGPDGSTISRLSLRREVSDSLRLAFRWRLPMALAEGSDRPRGVELARLRVLDGEELPAKVTVTAGAGVVLKAVGGGWSVGAGQGRAAEPLEWAGSGTPECEAASPTLATLPPLVASRLWLRTVQMPEGEAWASAWYRVEVHAGTFAVALPEGATWVRARIDGQTVGEIERLPGAAGYRLQFPRGFAESPAVVVLEYRLRSGEAPGAGSSASASASANAVALEPPRLLDGGLVQQTLWEVRVPWSRAAVGVPAGWTDENRWSWDTYVWKRHPRKEPEALATWVAGPSAVPPLPEDAAEDTRADFHGYLFGRPGDPITLRPWIASRAGLVGTFSGATLAIGLLLQIGLRRGRATWAAGLALAVAVAAAIQPSATLLAVQASAVGVALTIVATLTRRIVERRGPTPESYHPTSSKLSATVGHGVDAADGGPPAVGSDHSTVIRPRIPSTVDRVVPPPAVPAFEDRE